MSFWPRTDRPLRQTQLLVVEGDPSPGDRRICPRAACGPDRHADPWIRAIPPLHPGLQHRQGPARCRLSGMDRSSHGGSAPCCLDLGDAASFAPSTSGRKARRLCARRPGWQKSSSRALRSCTSRIRCPTLMDLRGAGGIREAAREELRRLEETSNIEADLLVLSGEPAHWICTAARGAEADVLVIGRGSASGVFGLALAPTPTPSSVSRRVRSSASKIRVLNCLK